jgi:uncharacterized protein (TIGR02145 family)
MGTISKRCVLIFFCLFTSDFLLFAQAPQAIPYQAIARNASGTAIASTAVKVRFSIRDSIATGPVRYQETHTPTTSALGLFSVNVGAGTVVSGSFAGINWGKNAKFLQVELDPAGGNTYTNLGTTQMMSVPYAMYAQTSGSSTPGPQGPAGPAGSGGFVHYVGEQFGGGVVFHVYRDASGTERGLVVALTNQSSGTPWSNITNQLAGANSSWDGLANSNAIVLQAGHANSAAKLCLDYSAGGFDDWYLPSTDELNKLADNRFEVNKALSGISGATQIRHFRNGTTDFDYLWSSSEADATSAWFYYTGALNGGKYHYDLKASNNQVRPIRTFEVLDNNNSVTDVDGNTYQTVTIGSQVWMKENLKVRKYRNGDAVPTNLSNTAWQNTTSGAYAIYDNNPVNDSIYGKLYNCYAVADPRGLCPAGWHVPSDSEWKLLEIFLGLSSSEADQNGARGLSSNIGGKLKETSTLWLSPNEGATNQSYFSGLPGGRKNNDGSFAVVRTSGFWWSSTEGFPDTAFLRHVDFNAKYCSRYGYYKTTGSSIRCLKD